MATILLRYMAAYLSCLSLSIVCLRYFVLFWLSHRMGVVSILWNRCIRNYWYGSLTGFLLLSTVELRFPVNFISCKLLSMSSSISLLVFPLSKFNSAFAIACLRISLSFIGNNWETICYFILLSFHVFNIVVVFLHT